jgi:hypothetical protein
MPVVLRKAATCSPVFLPEVSRGTNPTVRALKMIPNMDIERQINAQKFPEGSDGGPKELDFNSK